MKTVNAKGKVCPEPAAMAKAEVDRGETELEVLLDNPISASNVMRFFESNGFSVQLKDDEGAITISARKGAQPSKTAAFKKQPDAPAPAIQPNFAPQNTEGRTLSVLITGQALDRELGPALMKSFLGALSQMKPPPMAVALMYDGVKLALYDSSSCDHLKNLEKKGVSVLVCGTSADHFNILGEIGAGSISGMLEIVEILNRADKVMTI